MARSNTLTLLEIVIMVALSVAMTAASWFKLWSLDLTEVLGFASGGVCVWLVVREHIWNWPIGLANNVFFFILFLHSRLYADMALQVVYLVLGIYGWWNWVFGGTNHTELKIARGTTREWLWLLPSIPLAVWLLRIVLVKVNGAAPFWDSLTAVLSLAAQYLLCRKRSENWWFWIAADVIYVPLYFSKHLPLTAILYGVFLVMCLIGVVEWNRRLKREAAGVPPEEAAAA